MRTVMPASLNRAEHRALQLSLNEAVAAVNAGHLAWEQGRFTSQHVNDVANAQRTMAQKLARFEDREYILCDGTLNLMRFYEQMAADLVEGIEALTSERREECVRTAAGYTVSRRIVIAGRPYQYLVGCTNPAVGTLELDTWEAELRESLAFLQEKAA